MSVQLKPNGNLRAVWGLALSTSHCEPSPSAKDSDPELEPLNEIAVRKLVLEYEVCKNVRLAEAVRCWAQR
jgi:hypothetical protein